MPRQTSTGLLQVNLSIDPRAYDLLRRYAPSRRAYGRFISELIQGYENRQAGDELLRRIERLEERTGLCGQEQS
jgi:hypothetical protein